jgi:hypothetical protein
MKRQKEKELLYENLEGIQKEMFGFDEFFRDDELYNPVTDYSEDMFKKSVYEPDDLPIYTPNEMKTIDLNRYNIACKINTIETDLPEYIILKRTGQKFYIENLLLPGFSSANYENLMEKVADGYDIADIINIMDYSICKTGGSKEMQDEASRLLMEEYPLDYILDLMNQAKLKDKKGRKHYTGGLLTMLSKYPQFRDCFVTKNDVGGEYFDKELAKAAAARIFEVTNGCKYAAGQGMNGVLLCAALCGFGGLSVHAQSTEFLNDTDLSCLPYLFGKTLTALLCLFYGRILWTFFF